MQVIKKILGAILIFFGGLFLLMVLLSPRAPDGKDVTVPMSIVSMILIGTGYLLYRKKKVVAKVSNTEIVDVWERKEEMTAPDKANKSVAKEVVVQKIVPLQQDSGKEILRIARQEAASILSTARHLANELTKDISAKVQEAVDYDKAVRAMRNVIEGYGVEYLVPTKSALADLVEDFKHTDAAEALKEARAHATYLVKQGLAASCDYAEEYRKKTAIAFIVDAFNGKVDSIIARTKSDNIGKLQQEIKDAFSLVNINGKAFRDAKILPEYLVARLEEAKWGCAVVYLREQAKEEQRVIKERIRDEERAKRDYEKALREAAKEEESLQKALQKAQEDMALQVSDAEKSRLEEQIATLRKKLTDAENRASRAKSMAEMTSSGYVYIISNIGTFGENIYKIGLTRRLEPLDRVKELGDASVPFPFDVHAMIYSVNAPKLENELHRIFNDKRLNKVNYRKEFFNVSLQGVQDAVKALGHTIEFTMLAEAKEYAETKAMDNLSDAEKSNLLAKMLEQEAAQTQLDEDDNADI